MVKQLSVFVENKPGKIHGIFSTLSDSDINVRALSIADTSDFGILRLIVNSPDKAVELLRAAGNTVKLTDVLAVEVADQPGGLSSVLSIIKDCGVVIEYMYAFVAQHNNNAIVILRLDDMERGCNALKDNDVQVLSSQQVYSI